MLNKKSLKNQTLSGIAWRGSSDIIQQILQIIFTMILARLLSKSDFGLVAMAVLVNRFVKSVTNVSFGAAIIQSQEITKAQVSAIFIIQTTINISLTAIIFFGAEYAAVFFNEEELMPIVKVLSLLVLLQSLQFPNLLLQKKMHFKSFSMAQIASMLVSNIVAIILAFLEFGLWALVWRLIIQAVIFGLLSFYYGKWWPSKPSFKGLKAIMSFGFNLLGRNIFYFFAENMIGLMTGKYLGKEIMGLFNIAYNLAIVPASKIQNVLASVLMSGFSKIQYEVVKFRGNYKKALSYMSLIFIPFMLLLSAVSINLIPVLYGEKWQDAGVFLMILSIVGIMRGLSHMVRTAIVSVGKAKVVFLSAIVELVISLPIMYFLIKNFGVKGLIIGYVAGAFSGLAFLVFHFDKILDEKHVFIRSVKNGFFIGTIMFLLAIITNVIDQSDFYLMLLKIIISGGVYIVLLYLLERKIILDIKTKIQSTLLKF